MINLFSHKQYTVVTIGFVEDSITVDEVDLSAILRVRVLSGTASSAVVGVWTADDSAMCM